MDGVLTKLHELAQLPHGWRFSEGVPLHPRAVALAEYLYCTIVSFLPLKADVFPVVNGSVLLVFYRGTTCVELTIGPTCSIDVSVEQGHGFDFTELQTIACASSRDIGQAIYYLAQCTPLP